MKKTAIFFFLLVTFDVAFTTTLTRAKPPLKASEIYFPLGKSGQLISLQNLSVIKIRDFETMTGKKMKLFDKLNFKIGQRALKKSINYDGTFSEKKVEKYFNKMAEGGGGFHIGGFALGFFLGLIGVLIAYLIKDEKKKSRVLWSWIGCAVLVALILIL